MPPKRQRYEFATTGNTVVAVDANCLLQCPVCGKLGPIEFRRMGNGTIRNQPRCQGCRRYVKGVTRLDGTPK